MPHCTAASSEDRRSHSSVCIKQQNIAQENVFTSLADLIKSLIKIDDADRKGHIFLLNIRLIMAIEGAERE